jgi:hypothetical protein
MRKTYDEWVPDALKDEPQDFATDPLSEAVGRREDLDVMRDPEIDAAPVVTYVQNGRQASPREALVDHYAGPPAGTRPVVDRVEVRGHLDQPAPSTDRWSDDQLDQQAAEREAAR